MNRLPVAKALLASLLLSVAAGAAAPASATPAAGEASEAITYRLDQGFIYRGAFADSKEAWNKSAARVGAPLLRYDTDGRHVDLRIGSKCEVFRRSQGSTSAASYTTRPGAALMRVNRCAHLTWMERRKVYSHELGHAYLGPDHLMGLTVMRNPLEDQRAVYPTLKDERRLARMW